MRHPVRTLLFLTMFGAAQVQAQPPQSGNSELSKASELVGDGSAIVLVGSLSVLAASGTIVVKSIESVGEASVVVLRCAATGVSATVRLSGRAAKQLAVAVGTTVGVLAMSTGHALVLSGQVIAFVPNEIGSALLHQSPVRAPQE